MIPVGWWRRSLDFFQKQSGCEAVGIRLKDGDDFPYYEKTRFSDPNTSYWRKNLAPEIRINV